MPKSKRKLIPPTPEENAEINRQIAADPETADWSDPKNISVEQQIRELLYAEKFQPFQIVHKNGQVFDIVARDAAWVSPIGVYVVEEIRDKGRSTHIFDSKSLTVVSKPQRPIRDVSIRPRDNASEPATYRRGHREVVTEGDLLKLIPGLTSRQLRQLRLTRKIPYFAPSYRVRLYDPAAVIRALERLEILEVGSQRRRG
jgi:hypothetical protein